MRQAENIGQSAARNLAAKNATGDLLAFLDDDCRATQDWLRQLVPWILDPAVDLVGGRIQSYTNTGWLAAFEEASSPLDMGPEASWVGPGAPLAYIPSSNMLIDRRVYLELNGFEPAMRVGEDVDFSWRAASTGRGVRYIPSGIVYHLHRIRIKQFLMRRADYGSSEADLDRRHPEMRRRMQLIPSSLILLFLPSIFCISSTISLVLATLFGSLILIDLARKWATQKEFGLGLSVWDLVRAILGKHTAAFYHLCANLLRYYGLFFLAMGLLWPSLAPMTAIVFCVPPVVNYYRKRPLLPGLAFISIYWLEMLAYQIGVWRGCFRHKRFGPLFPRIKISL
jgi:mycofactocin system glycosyltransferase